MAGWDLFRRGAGERQTGQIVVLTGCTRVDIVV